MILSKSPMRISLFGGSTDYKSFYEKYGSFIIGTTINKYYYSTIRFMPLIIRTHSIIKYSKFENINNLEEIQNPLIRETLKYYNITVPFELCFDSDVPARTGLGGSSSCCAALAKSICTLLKIDRSPSQICSDIIKIERDILKDPGGIQDQIWACHGGFNSITIDINGNYKLSPIFTSIDYKKEFENSLVLIYSQQQRENINSEYINPEKENIFKLRILYISKLALDAFKKQDTELIGKLLYDSWLEKRNISKSITNNKIDNIIDDIMRMGGYGAKLLGNGSAGFILAVCNKKTKKHLREKYKDVIMDFKFSRGGIKTLRL